MRDDLQIWLTRPIFDLFRETACRDPNHVALDDGKHRLTYADLLNRSLRLATVIAHETPENGLVGILLPHDIRQPVAVLACLASGRPCLLLDTNTPATHMGSIIANAIAKSVILPTSGPGSDVTLPQTVAPIPVSSDGEVTQAYPLDVSTASPLVPAFVLYTSGSTGQPKGIVLSQQAMLYHVIGDITSCCLTSADRFMAPFSPATISPLRRLLAALLIGGTLHLLDLHKVGFGGAFARLQHARITIAALFPSILRAIVQQPVAKDAFRSLRVLRVGGEDLDWRDVAALRAVLPDDCIILFAYGSTELPPVVEHPIGRGPHPAAGRVPSGWPVPGSILTLIDEAGIPVPPGEPGEVVARSRYLALGHWVDGECRSGPMLSDPTDPTVRIFHTGDLLRLLPDGAYEFIGRLDRQVKIRGNRVEPAETEAMLRRIPGVADAAVIAHFSGDQASLIAFILPLNPRPSNLLALIRAMVGQHLAAPLRPSRVVFIEAIPYLPNFKLDLAALRLML